MLVVVIVVVTGPAGVIVLCRAIVSLAGSNLLLSENGGGEGRLLSLSCDSPRASTQLDAVVGVVPRYFIVVAVVAFGHTEFQLITQFYVNFSLRWARH